jgi:hypothetical protein
MHCITHSHPTRRFSFLLFLAVFDQNQLTHKGCSQKASEDAFFPYSITAFLILAMGTIPPHVFARLHCTSCLGRGFFVFRHASPR